jgi:hypothetical protein
MALFLLETKGVAIDRSKLMKRTLVAGIILGVASLAQATSITLLQGGSLDGANAYVYQILASSLGLGSGQSLTAASVTFNNISLTTSSPVNTFGASLIDANKANTTYNDNDHSGRYFTTSTFLNSFNPDLTSSAVHDLGTKTFNDPHWNWSTWSYDYDTQTWTWDITGSALTALNADLTGSLHGADIGVDPDCVYTVGSIMFNYTAGGGSPPQSAPDGGMTAGLLGMGLVGLATLRRKLAVK